MAFGRGKRRKKSDDALLKMGLQWLTSSENHMRTVMEQVEYSRSVVKGTSHPDYGKARNPNDVKDWESREFPPVAWEHAELLNAELTLDDPRFSFTARQSQFYENARTAEDALDYYLDRDRFAKTFRLATKSAIRDRAAVLKIGWAPDKQPMMNLDGSPMVDDDGNPVMDDRGGRLRVMLTRMEDNFPDPTATSEENARFWFFRSYATLDDLHARRDNEGKPFYKNLNRLRDAGGASSDDDNKKRDGETEEAFKARTEGMQTLHECWTPYGRFTIANKSVIIRRDDKLPMKHGRIPVAVIRLIDDEDSMFGVSPMSKIGPLQMLYWFFFNKLADATTLAVKPVMLADTEDDPQAANQVIYPGAVLHSRNGEQTLKVIQDLADLSKYDVMQILGLIRDLMERISGMNSSIAGQSNSDTASEAAMNLRQGKGRTGGMLDVSDECWAYFADIAYQTIQQYSSTEINAKLSGLDGREVSFSPEQLQDMMISPKPASNERALKDLERQDLESAMGLLMEIAVEQGAIPQVAPEPVMRRWLDSLNVESDSVIVGPPLPPPQEEPMPPAPPAGGGGEPGPDSTPEDMSGAAPDVLDEYGEPMPGAPS